jgi:putative transposase
MKFRFMYDQRHYHRVAKMAAVLGVSRGGYYAWLNAAETTRQRRDRELVKAIRKIQKKKRFRYGTPRMTDALHKRGYRVGHNRVARLMAENGLHARRRRKYRVTTMSKHNHRASPNLLNRNFNPPAPNVAWASDLTYVDTAEGWLYLCVILDLYNRRVIGWSMSHRMGTDIVVQALFMALLRTGNPKGVLFHSDRGVQYAAKKFRRILNRYEFVQSMSRKGNCWDNAVVESFFSTLKSELIQGYRYPTRQEAKDEIFEYIEVFYNRERSHSYLGYETPAIYGSHAA